MFRSAVALSLVLFMTGCSDDSTSAALPPPVIKGISITPISVAAGGTVTMVVVAENFTLVEEHDEGDAGDLGHHEPDSPNVGHFHVYLDDLMTNPLAMPVTDTFAVTIPADTASGPHSLIVRLHAASHKIIEPQVTLSSAVTVE